MSQVRKDHSLSQFQEDWLTDDRFKEWVKRVPTNSHKAYCIICAKSINVTSSGCSALISHAKSKCHNDKIEQRSRNVISNYLAKPSLDVEVATPLASPSCSKTQTKLAYDCQNETIDAEILWSLYVVQTHQSYRSCDLLNKIFKRAFKNDPAAQNFQLKKDKARYFIIYGIFPFFQKNVISNIRNSLFFSLSFDESYNRDKKMCQMDVNIRFWNNIKNIAETSYLTSKFLLRPNAENLKKDIFASLEPLEKSKFIHLSMDGPTVNWNVLQLVDDELDSMGHSKTLNIGSCSLHILHGALGTAISSTDWNFAKLLKAMFKIFDESPARSDVYLKEGSSEKFPIKFCETRWIEDEKVADRALEVWPSVVKTVKYWQGLCKSKRPNNKSYERLVENYLDLLVPAKLQFFSFLASIMSPYLIMYQTDAPMVPFMFDELSTIVYRLLRLVYKQGKINEKKFLSDLMKDAFLQNKENKMDVLQIDVGAAAKNSLSLVQVSAEKKRKFRNDCQKVVEVILLKLLERLPINKSLVIQASSLSPINMQQSPNRSTKRFKALSDNLFAAKKIKAKVADNAKSQYEKFINTCVVKHAEKFMEFDFRKERLDEFLYPFLGKKGTDFGDLWTVSILIFTINHGQAFTERGFSINKHITDTNMEEDSLIAQRLIYDVLQKHDGDVSEYPITKDLRKSCRQAHSRMVLDKEKKKLEVERSDQQLKRKSKQDEIATVKKRKFELEKVVVTLKDALMKEAIASGTCGNKVREHATKAAAFAKELKEKEETLKELFFMKKS